MIENLKDGIFTRMEDQMSELRASLPQMVRDLVPLQHPTTPSDDAPPHDVTHDAPPAVSSLFLLNGQSVSPAATSANRWKIPFTEHNVISGSGCHPPFVAITESWLKSYMQMHKFPSMTIMPTGLIDQTGLVEDASPTYTPG